MTNLAKVYGIHAVESLLVSYPKTITKLLVINSTRIQKILYLANKHGIPIQKSNKIEFNKLIKNKFDYTRGRVVHQGVIAETNKLYNNIILEKHLLESSSNDINLLLVLDCINDPHNLGSCIRTANAAGVQAIIIPKHKSVTLNSTVRKVACGAAELVPICTVNNLTYTLSKLQKNGFWIVGTVVDSRKTIYNIDLNRPIAFVMGSEGKGIRNVTKKYCDYLVNIPSPMNSLNVSVATGICLFEALRQRHFSTNLN